MAARFAMCKAKGFDAVDPDNMDGYESGHDTGFPLTAQEQLVYNEWIAQDAHALGLAIFQKNDSEQVTELQPHFDGEINEQCNQYRGECALFGPYLAANKPVENIEYSPSSSFCAADNAAGITGARYDEALDGGLFEPCW